MRPTFASTTTLKVDRDTPVITPLGSSIYQPGYDPYYQNTEFDILKSDAILLPVANSLHLDRVYAEHNGLSTPLTSEKTLDQLRRDVDVRQHRSTSLIDITANSWDNHLAAKIANEIADSYQKYRTDSRSGNYQGGLTAVTNKLAELRALLEAKTAEVDKLKVTLEVPDVVSDSGQFQSLSVQELQNILRTKTELETKLANDDNQLKRLEAITNVSELRHTVLALRPIPSLEDLMRSLADAEQAYVSKKREYGTNHPEVLKVHDLVAKINSQVDATVGGILEAMRTSVASSRDNLTRITQHLEAAERKDSENLIRWRPYVKEKHALERLQKEFDSVEAYFVQESLNVDIPKSSSVKVIGEAKPAEKPVRPNKLVNITLGLVFGGLLGVGLAFFIEYLDTSVKTIDDVEKALGAPVLGVIPQNVGLLTEQGEEGPHGEAYRVLRTNILFLRKEANLRTLTVVSGGAGEGKSTTVFNLAVVFAQQGSKVLLVDSDLRRPSLHKMFNVSNSVGLTNYLFKQVPLEQAVLTTKVDNLHFLPSGKLPSSSLGILSSTAMRAFLDEVKSRYDFVFFDSPPILGVSDASILASAVDLSILVVHYRKYPQRVTIRAKQFVEKIGGRLLGVVLNNINISQDSYYYYYTNYYYDYYGKDRDNDGNVDVVGKSVDDSKTAPKIKGKF